MDPTQQPDILQTILANAGSGNYQLTPDQLSTINNYFLQAGIGLQAGQLDYQNRYLDYLNKQEGLGEGQLAQAQQQLQFQTGPYWQWYKDVYFPAQQKMSDNQLGISNDQLGISANQLASSAQDVHKSVNYALAQQYQTQQAELARDVSKWQALAQFGPNFTTAMQLADGRTINANPITYGYYG